MSTSKRLLLLEEDPLLGDVYRERFETAGFFVNTARDARTAGQMLSSAKPDLVVIDPLLPDTTVGEYIASVRGNSAANNLPIYVLPTVLHGLAQSAQEAGATQVLEQITTPVRELVVSLTGSANGASTVDEPNARWEEATLAIAPANLHTMRKTVHALTHNLQDHDLLRSLLQQVHTFAQHMALMGPNPIWQFACAFELFVFHLEQFPERLESVSLRTLGQGVDFIGKLLDDGAHKKRVRLEDASVMIVEDEANARELIIAAMNLVGLRADGVDNPEATLALLNAQKYDLIFMDINLPAMNGFEVCTKVREMPQHEGTPIVFLTGMTSFQNRVQSSLSGGNDFVGKPFNIAELGVKALIWVMRGQLGLA